MHIKFLSMHLENFMSFREADIDFSDTGYTIVSGSNENPVDSAYSNGSGKSSIWEAISWCLTGSTIRGSKSVSNVNIEKSGALVDLSFNCNDALIRLVRSKDHDRFKTNLQIFVNGEDMSGKGIREGEAILQNLLPDLTADLIGSVIILGQGLPCKLSSKTPAGRKELLERLTKSDFMIEDIKSRLSSRKNDLQSELTSVNAALIELNVRKDTCEKELASSHEKLVSMNIDKTKSRYNEVSKKLEELIQSEKIAQANLTDLEQQSSKLATQYDLLSSNKNSIDNEVKDKYEKELSRLTQEIATKNAEINVNNNELKKALQVPTLCPVCGRPMDTGHIEINTNSIQQRIFELTQDVDRLSATKKDLSGQWEIELKLKTSDLLKQLDQCAKDKTKTSDDIRTLNIFLRGLYDDISSYTGEKSFLESEIKHFNETIEELNNRINSLHNELNDLSSKILYNNKEVENISKRQDVINKMITSANRDFRGYLLSGIIQYIDNFMKHYCQIVFGHTGLSFRLDGNSLDILYCDRYYESLSGGERQKIDLIVQLAVRKMLCNLSDFSSNIIVLDEIFDAMDKLSCQKIIDFLTNELCDVEAIYIITHHDDLQIPCDHEIRVIKDRNGISRIE